MMKRISKNNDDATHPFPFHFFFLFCPSASFTASINKHIFVTTSDVNCLPHVFSFNAVYDEKRERDTICAPSSAHSVQTLYAHAQCKRKRFPSSTSPARIFRCCFCAHIRRNMCSVWCATPSSDSIRLHFILLPISFVFSSRHFHSIIFLESP